MPRAYPPARHPERNGVRDRARRRAAQRPSSWLSASGIPKVAREVLLGQHLARAGPAATTRPSRSSSAWVKPGGISSTWWETSTVAGDVVVHRERGQRRDEVLAAAEVEARRPARRAAAARGRSSAPGRSARACAPPRSGCRRCGRRSRPAPTSREQLVGPVVVELVVALAPAPDHAVRRGDHDVVDQLVRAGSARPARRWSARSGAAARRRRRCRAPRRGSRRPRRWGGSARRRPAAGWSCRRRWGRAPPSARPPRRSSRSPSSRVAWPRRTVTSANSRTASMCSRHPRARRFVDAQPIRAGAADRDGRAWASGRGALRTLVG